MAADERVVGRDLGHDDNTLGSDTALKIVEAVGLRSRVGEGWTSAVDAGAKVMKQAANLLGVAPADITCER